MILDLTSFGWSGCGAYHDLIREFDKIEFPSSGDFEFHLLWTVDGIYDLEQKLCTKTCRVYDSAYAVKRFLYMTKQLGSHPWIHYNKIIREPSFYQLSKEYIDKLVSIRFPAHSFVDCTHPNKWENLSIKWNHLISRLFSNRVSSKLGLFSVGETLQFYNAQNYLIAYRPADFLQITQDYVADLIARMRTDESKVFISDQMFPPDCPELFYKYVKEDFKTIIVRRDPRDTYITMKRGTKFPFPVPHTIDEFIWFYKHIVEDTRLEDNDRRLSMNFEDLIYKYDETIDKLTSFIDLGKHVAPRTKFNPTVSINNTQLIKLYPEYKEDIDKIEKALPNSLYPFEKYPFNRTSNKIF